jgi:hypothetical protein
MSFEKFLFFFLCFLVEYNIGRGEMGSAVFCIRSPKKKFSLSMDDEEDAQSSPNNGVHTIDGFSEFTSVQYLSFCFGGLIF